MHIDPHKKVFIINELGDRTLRSLLKQESISWQIKVNILKGVSNGLAHLHSCDPCILHLDLKSENVLLFGHSAKNSVPKLCDFGLAVEMRPGLEYIMFGNGTIQYMAPEVIRDDDIELSKGFDEGADVYSFSMIMWEVAHNDGRLPWEGEVFEQDIIEGELGLDQSTLIQNAVLQNKRPKVTCEIPLEYNRIMEACWQQDSYDRPRFSSSRSSRHPQLISTLLSQL